MGVGTVVYRLNEPWDHLTRNNRLWGGGGGGGGGLASKLKVEKESMRVVMCGERKGRTEAK